MDNFSSPIDLAAEIAGALYPVSSSTAALRGDTDKAGLQSCFDVTGLAVSSIGAACAELAALSSAAPAQDLLVSRRLASLWFDMTIRPQGWQMPPVWDAIAGLYRAKDHWIRLHTNALLHREAALKVLDCEAQRDAVARRVADWGAEDLEQTMVANGGCAALLRSIAQWNVHAQGRAVASEPLIAWTPTQLGAPVVPPATDDLPLRGLRVLDCTRVLAGPVCTRLLAGFGAEVLRIDPPAWDEANVEPEVTLGKRLATLNLREPSDKARFEALLAKSDLFIHGYRPGALDDLGLGENRRRELNPQLIDVALSAYGQSGPWASRRGYDSLVQMSTGIVHEGMLRGDGETPTPLPVQALDHATGYLMAAAALRALRVVRESGTVLSARLSLARTAELLKRSALSTAPEAFSAEDSGDLAPGLEDTFWGPARRIRFPLVSGVATPKWSLPARPLHSDSPQWSS